MPDPDPHPPQPRTISTWRWLLMLLPSVPFFFAGPVAVAWSRDHDAAGEATIGPLLGSWLISFTIAVMFSAVLGAQMEKWKRGAIESVARVSIYALNILFTACIVGWGGCALMNKYFDP